ncbi:acyltransferase [Granulosicoccus sp.]|nr:acyltransferase [Granulosicoccus sp.]MDB4223183.1 acyltransferase [Granulosicoccus sp.]
MVSTVAIFPLYLGYRLLALFSDKNSLFASFSQFLSLYPGKIGSYLRNSFYSLVMTRCEPRVVFSFGTLFSQIDTEVASGTYIGPQCNIGSCNIGRDCLIGSGVHILSGKQQHTIDDLDTPIREQGGLLAKISIGNDCWIGNGAIVMADVGNQCVIAAGAVVVNPVPDRMIVAGNPAVVIKKR